MVTQNPGVGIMNTCQYCEKNHKTHIDAREIMSVLDDLELPNEHRAKIVKFILQVENQHNFHTTHALDVVKRICEKCGEDKEREDDGDRYYWICLNDSRNCPSDVDEEIERQREQSFSRTQRSIETG